MAAPNIQRVENVLSNHIREPFYLHRSVVADGMMSLVFQLHCCAEQKQHTLHDGVLYSIYSRQAPSCSCDLPQASNHEILF